MYNIVFGIMNEILKIKRRDVLAVGLADLVKEFAVLKLAAIDCPDIRAVIAAVSDPIALIIGAPGSSVKQLVKLFRIGNIINITVLQKRSHL